MFEDTRPAELDATGGPDPWAPFRVGSAAERLRVMRDLRDRSVPVMLHSRGGSALATTLWALDATQQRVGFSADATELQRARLVESDEVVAVAYDENVKLQFELHGMVLVRSATACTLQCGMPDEIYRFQRRSAYRVRPPAKSLPVARLRHPDQPELVLALRIIDLSIGGCALWLPHEVAPPQPGTPLGPMRCELDTETRFTVTATLRHVLPATIDPGGPRGHAAPPARGVRLGCEWRPSDGLAERSLQRWIDQTQRRRRLLTMM